MKKYIILILKIFVSSSLAYWFFSQIDFDSYLEVLMNVQFVFFFLAWLFYALAVFVFTYKWKVLLDMLQVNNRYKNLVCLNLVSLFYAAFLPGGFLTGESIKGWRFVSQKDSKVKRAVSIVLDRMLGAVAFIFLGFLSYFFSDTRNTSLTSLYYFLLIGALFIFFVIVFPQVRKIFAYFLIKILEKIKKDQLVSWLGVKFSFAYLARALVWGMVFLLVQTSGLFFVILSVGEQVAFFDLVWINALVSVVTMIPLTILGIGLREASLYYLLGLFGVALAKTLSVATLVVIIFLLRALPGGLWELGVFYKSSDSHKLK